MTLKIKKRSPSAPSLSLEDAIEKALNIYNNEGLHPMHPDVAAHNVGYSNATNGAAGAVLATLKVFGLLLSPAKGQLAIADAVQDYKQASDEASKAQLCKQWISTPKVYRSIFDRYGSSLPSDTSLCHFLVTELNFKDFESAAQCVTKFRESLEFLASVHQKGETRPSEPESSPVQQVLTEPLAEESKVALQVTRQGFDRIPIRLSNGRKAWLEIPDTFHEQDKTIIKAQIDLIVTD